jgi:hypothetical protein
MFSQLRLIVPGDAPLLFISESIVTASKFFVRAIFRQQPSINPIQNLAQPCPRVPLIGKLSNLLRRASRFRYKSPAKIRPDRPRQTSPDSLPGKEIPSLPP